MLGNRSSKGFVAWAAAVVVALGLGALPARAHETDQFSVPSGREMADLGPYINDLFVEQIEEAVARVNEQIRRAVEDDGSLRRLAQGHGKARRPRPSQKIDPEQLLAVCQSPEGIAQATWQSFGSAVDLIERLEDAVKSKEMARRYPGKVVGWNAADRGESIYSGLYFPLDPRTAFRLFHASTIKVYGYYLGTDKIGHFTDMGYHYFREYRKQLKAGKTPEEAMLAAKELGTDGPFSEKAALGYATAGAYSNADLVSNYVGCLFYRNLTESVYLKGELCPPMLERDGEYWKVADFVREDPRFVERFFSLHWDEALNPSHFQPIIQPTLKKKIAERVPELLKWYAPLYGDKEPRAFFHELMLELSTYYGADYGHSGHLDELVGLWNSGGGSSFASREGE